jgi:hypothetical protein
MCYRVPQLHRFAGGTAECPKVFPPIVREYTNPCQFSKIKQIPTGQEYLGWFLRMSKGPVAK